MRTSLAARVFTLVVTTAVLAIAASLLFELPYIFTFLAVAGIVVIGHVVTIDDDMPGGWSNPDGAVPCPWQELLVKLSVLAFLVLLAFVPWVRQFGG